MPSTPSPTSEYESDPYEPASPGPADRPTLTERHFFKYATCPHWIWFDRFGDPAKRVPRPPISQLFQGAVVASRAAAIRKAFKRRKIQEVHATGPADAAAKTLAQMKEGVEIVANGGLTHQNWVGHPDLLIRQKGSSTLGRYHYFPALVERGTRAASLQKLLLAFWAVLLEKIQGVRPDIGLIITKDGRKDAVPIAEVLPRFTKIATAIEATLAGTRPAPFLSGGCRESPWFSECRRLAEESKDLTLIAGLSRSVVQSLRSHGILSIDDAAAMDTRALQGKASGFTRSALGRIKDQASALLTHKAIPKKRPRFPRARTELFLDLEGNPFRGIDYLIGVLIVDHHGVRYRPFFAGKPDQERQMWRSFLTWLKTLPAHTQLYHFGYYERQKLGKTLPERYGGGRALSKILSRAVDLRKVIEQSVVLPVYFHTLKDVGKHLGYRWSDSDAGGAQSVVWYEQWLERSDDTARAKILEYNRNDVEATRVIKEWLAGLKKEKRDT